MAYQMTPTDELEATREALQNTTQELDSLCYAISHDLRAPLRVVAGFSRALEEDFGDSLAGDAIEYVSRIRRNVSQMDEMVARLVNLARIGRVPLRIERVHLSAIVREALAAAKEAEPLRRVKTEVQNGVWVRGDRSLLTLALSQLVENAWKFSTGRDEATIAFGVKTEDPRYVSCYVRDNGVGFDMAFAGRLFAPFQRLHRQEEFSGVGMGLATVQRVVHRHGGRVSAEATPNEGAIFYISLPGGGIHGCKGNDGDAQR